MSQKLLEPKYTTFDSVKVRLTNKVQFQASSELVNGELPDALLAQIISDAETEVEQDLRGRYAIPFRSKSFGTFAALPDHSKRAIRMAVDMKAVFLILMTDFGRGSHINGEEYANPTDKNYDKYIAKLLGRDQEAAGSKHDRFRYTPPLEDMTLSASNREADDGFKGRIINTDGSTTGAESFAVEQIDNPARTIFNKRILGGNEVL